MDTKTRQREWGYGEISVDDIVDGALSLVEQGGLDNLTMRGLAHELGVSTAVAYYHVPNKEALLHLVADAVLGRVPLPDSTKPWDEQLRQMLWNKRTHMLRYPGISQVLASLPVLPNFKRVGDVIDSILVGAGFDDDAAAMGVTMLAVYVLGFVNWELSLEVRRSVSQAKGDNAQPALRNPARDAESSFEFGLQNILYGLHETLRRQQRQGHGVAPNEPWPLGSSLLT
jgi:TetR/AcrR family transcriptional regulator, tetracycline repressor protein